MLLVPSKYISGVHFLLHIIKAFIIAVGNDSMTTAFEIRKIIDNKTTKEGCTVFKCRLIDNNLCPFSLNALHNSLDRTLAEVVTIRLHCQSINTNDTFFLFVGIIVSTVVVIIITSRV